RRTMATYSTREVLRARPPRVTLTCDKKVALIGGISRLYCRRHGLKTRVTWKGLQAEPFPQETQPDPGGGKAVHEIDGIDGDPAAIIGFLKVCQHRTPVDISLSDRCRLCPSLRSNQRVAAANVADERAELRERFVQVPFIPRDGDRIQINPEPGAVGADDRLPQRSQRRQLA